MSSEILTVYQHLLGEILGGRLKVNDKLPTEMEIAKQFSTNRMVASTVVKNLEEHGLVFRKKRYGTLLVKKPTLLEARDVVKAYANRIHILGVINEERVPLGLHWNNTTLSSLEQVLNDGHYNLVYHDISKMQTREKLEAFLATDLGLYSHALVFLPAMQPESIFLMENYDIIYRYHRNVYILDNGTTPMDTCPFNRLCLGAFQEGLKAAEYLLKFQNKKFAFIKTDPENLYYNRERRRGVEIGMLRAGEGVAELEVWDKVDLDKVKSNDYILLAPTTSGAYRLLASLEKDGMKPPKDYSLIGFDDSPTHRKYNITNVAPPMDRIGSLLGEMICCNVLDRDKNSQLVVNVEPRVIERETCRLDDYF